MIQRLIEAANWDDLDILGGWCGSKMEWIIYGVWVGVSKQGWFAFLVDSSLLDDEYSRFRVTYEDSYGPWN
ncbi:hypothetical protein Bca4012_054168 [Brassica carinata]